MAEADPPHISHDFEERRERRQDDDYRRDRDRHQRRHRRNRSRSRDRHSNERRHSRRRSRSRSRSGSRHRSRSRSRNRDGNYRHMSRNEEFDYDQGDIPRRNFEMGDPGYSDSFQDTQGHTREERGRTGGGKRHERDWRMKLTSIRDAHFNRSKQPPLAAQNQFQNDGSFMEMFKKKMAAESSAGSSLTPNSLVLASSSIPYSSDISLPPLTAPAEPKQQASSSADQDLDGVPIKRTTLPVPVSVGRRRCAKPLKTGVVFKKQQQTDEDEGSQEKLDAWSRYLQEVQKYKNDNMVEEDTSRPLVK